MRSIVISSGPYRRNVLVVVGASPRQMAREVKSRLRGCSWWKAFGRELRRQVGTVRDYEGRGGKTWLTPLPVVWLRDFEMDSAGSVGVLVHEMLHVANFVLEQAAVKVTLGKDEAQAYLLEYLVAQCYEGLSAGRGKPK